MKLCELARDCGITISETLAKGRQCLAETWSAFVEHEAGTDPCDFRDCVGTRLCLGRQEAKEKETVCGQSCQAQGCDGGGRPGDRVDGMPCCSRSPHELVPRVGDQRRSRIAHKCDGLLTEGRDVPIAVRFARVIVVAVHRRLRSDVGEQLGGHSCVFGKDSVRAFQSVRGTRRKIALISDRCCHDVEARREPLIHREPPLSSSKANEKESSSLTSSAIWGEDR